MSHSAYVISLSPQAKWYVLIWFKYLIPLTCLKLRVIARLSQFAPKVIIEAGWLAMWMRKWMLIPLTREFSCHTINNKRLLPIDHMKMVRHRKLIHRTGSKIEFIGVIYECAPCNSMTTTHDKEYTVGNFPGKRTIPRSDYQSDKAPITTMKKDFDYKKVAEKAQPYRPPGTHLRFSRWTSLNFF